MPQPVPPTAYPYWYATTFSGTLAANATTTLSIRFEEGTIFQAQAMFCRTDLDLISTVQAVPIIVKISDSGTGQQLSNDFVMGDAVFGSYSRVEGLLPAPIQFSGKSTINFEITNVHSASISTLRIAIQGLRWTGTPMVS